MNTPITLSLIITTGVVIIVALDYVKTFLLKREQIKADTIVRTEEVKAKNQLEIEKLLRQDQFQNSNRFEESGDERTVRERKNT